MTHMLTEAEVPRGRRGRQENPAGILKHLRDREQFTQEDLARIIRERAMTISRWERRVVKPRPQAAAKVRRLGELEREARGVLTPLEFKEFLVQPHRLLMSLAPMDMLDNDPAFERVLDLVRGMQASDAV